MSYRKNVSDIDIGLDFLCLYAKPGQTLQIKDIADVCNVSPARIGQISNQGLKKIRRLADKYHLSDYDEEEVRHPVRPPVDFD